MGVFMVLASGAMLGVPTYRGRSEPDLLRAVFHQQYGRLRPVDARVWLKAGYIEYRSVDITIKKRKVTFGAYALLPKGEALLARLERVEQEGGLLPFMFAAEQLHEKSIPEGCVVECDTLKEIEARGVWEALELADEMSDHEWADG